MNSSSEGLFFSAPTPLVSSKLQDSCKTYTCIMHYYVFQSAIMVILMHFAEKKSESKVLFFLFENFKDNNHF